MGSFCSCFDADDPLDNTDNANNDNGIIPNLCNKVRTYVLQLPTFTSPFLFSAIYPSDSIYMFSLLLSSDHNT